MVNKIALKCQREQFSNSFELASIILDCKSKRGDICFRFLENCLIAMR